MNKIEIKTSEMVGNLYSPIKQKSRLPAIVLLSGSDGGIPGANAIPEQFIETLVSNNFVVLALAYFGVDGLPQNLEYINLEYFKNAFSWLNEQPQVKPDTFGIIGNSRGGELSLILGTLFPEYIKSITCYVPCNMICGGFPYPNKPAWMYKGKPFNQNFLHGVSNFDVNLTELDDLNEASKKNIITPHANTPEDPFILAELFEARNHQNDKELTEIPVENIQCPLLLFSGGQDAIWPANYYCQMIVKRLEKHNVSISHQHVNYKDAGHGIFASRDGSIYHPLGRFWCKLGGTIKGNDDSKKESLIELLDFLDKTLKNN